MTTRDLDENDLDQQYRRPFGEVGRHVGQAMARDHLPENLWTVEQLNPQPTDHILEVGFGPGVAIEETLKRVTDGFVAGVDFSQTMVAEASKRNADAIQDGWADLRYGEASDLPFDDSTFDKAYSIHSIYFWPRPDIALKELFRVLKPGGLLVLTILPKDNWPPNAPGSVLDFGTPDCTPYYGREIEQMLTAAGFTSTRIVSDPTSTADINQSNYSILANKPS